jgi:hypothetical protein
MVKFVPVDPDEVPNFRESHRGRVSYPILKSFLETGMVLVKLDRTGIQQSLQSLNSSLGAYIRNHGLPVKIFNRMGEIYLMRLDADEEGNVQPTNIHDYGKNRPAVGQAPPELKLQQEEIPLVDGGVVEEKYEEEKDQALK